MSNSSLTARLTRAAGGATNLQLLLVCIAVLITMSFANPRFLNAYNFESMAFFLPELGILSIAVMIAMLTGGIDLSIVGLANLSAIAAGLFFQRMGGAEAGIGTVLIGVAIALSVGLLGGLINGWLISRLLARS